MLQEDEEVLGPAVAPRRAVYRALIGGYEELREEDVARDSDVPFICFTDDSTLTSKTWEVVCVEPRMHLDSTRSARALKILGHPVLDDYDETLWVDNTVGLRQPPDALFDEWLADADVAAPLHSFRSSVLAEAEAVLDAGLDDVARVYEQLSHYLAVDGEGLEDNPHWTGMLARRRTPATTAAMTAWWEDVLRYSRRDQLSFVPVMRRNGVRVASQSIDSHTSRWHEWPVAEGRDPAGRGSGLREALRPPAARIGALQQALDETTRTLAVTVGHRDEVIARHDETITGLHESLAEANQRAHDTRVELDTVRHQRNVTAAELADARRIIELLEQQLASRPISSAEGLQGVARRLLGRD